MYWESSYVGGSFRIDFPMITKQPSMCGGWLCPFTSKPRRIALNVNFEMLFSTYNKKKEAIF